jgi:hypothetical protein
MVVSGQRHALAALYARCPLDRRLGRPQSRTGHKGYRKNPFGLCRGLNPDRPVVQSVVIHYTKWAIPAPWSHVEILHPSRMFARAPFWNGWSYGIKHYGFEVTFGGINSLLNFIKIHQIFQKLKGRQTDRHSNRMVISLAHNFSLGRKVG